MPLVVSRITPGSPVSKFLRLLIPSFVIPPPLRGPYT